MSLPRSGFFVCSCSEFPLQTCRSKLRGCGRSAAFVLVRPHGWCRASSIFPSCSALRSRCGTSRRGSRSPLATSSMMWTNALLALCFWYAVGSWDVSSPPAYRVAQVVGGFWRRSAELLVEDVRRFYHASGGQLFAFFRLTDNGATGGRRDSVQVAPSFGSGAEWIDRRDRYSVGRWPGALDGPLLLDIVWHIFHLGRCRPRGAREGGERRAPSQL